MNYNLIRPFLFCLGPELSHNFSLKAIKLLQRTKLLQLVAKPTLSLKKQLLGMDFENPIGLAAGLDKSGDFIDALGELGFGFIEIGTVTPKPQLGNPKPRMFRLVKDKAIINRMGFNNKGVEYLVTQLYRKKYQGILGINIGKNAITPIENAIDDYRYCLSKVYIYASYVTINISSPNTPGLRNLQEADYLANLVKVLKAEQYHLANHFNKYVPLFIKVAPDLDEAEIQTMANIFGDYKIDAVITTNTTIERKGVTELKYVNESGGLSGQPLFDKSTKVLAQFKKYLQSFEIPVIASGGILTPKQAVMKIEAGADLIQLYTGLIFSGPKLISACCHALGSMTNTTVL
jgi:dihydroorotate dehydrogenase